MALKFQKRERDGRQLRAIVDEMFSSYTDFAQYMGVSRQQAHSWFSGAKPIPERIIDKLRPIILYSADEDLFRG